jgi:methyl-accepting chemotaxis protein
MIVSKTLAQPDSFKERQDVKSNEMSLDLAKKREQAKKLAKEKSQARTLARRQAIAERLSSAVQQMSASMEEASSASEQLGRNMESIATAAQQASSAAEESRVAIGQIVKASDIAVQRAKESLNKVNRLQELARTTNLDIEQLIRGVNDSADANKKSAELIRELEKYSEQIGDIVGAVVRIADQTNLLALNAAIEAARAGEHGRGFAVVADEVRNLAEISEKSATGIRQVVDEIQQQVQQVVKDVEASVNKSMQEVENGKGIAKDLEKIAVDMIAFIDNCKKINQMASEAQNGANEFLKGSEDIASNAEEQSSAAEEATKSLSEQNKAFTEMQSATDDLGQMAEMIKTSTDTQKSAEEIAANSEELSANIEEGVNASRQIMIAIEQIAKGALNQSKAAEENKELGLKLENASKAMAQEAMNSEERIQKMMELLTKNKINVDKFIAEIGVAANESVNSAKNIVELTDRTNNIDKIVDQIVNVTLKTDMLAVNGSVEAARAGEYGRGFSVVAADIRTLANESSENADKIKNMVRRMQKQITIVASDIEASGRTAAKEVESAKKSTANLEMIEKDTLEIQSNIKEINLGAQESLTALEQANKAVAEIASSAEEADKVVTEAKKAAEEGYTRMQEIAKAVEDIASQADEMQNK